MTEWRETIEAVRLFGPLRVLYWRLAYRPHMLFIHKRGRHQMKAIHPMGGPSFSRCDWCGHVAPRATERSEG